MNVSEIAFASGFQSIRRFNDLFKKYYNLSPREARKKSGHSKNVNKRIISLSLNFRPPYNWLNILKFLQLRAINSIEKVTYSNYYRAIRIDNNQYFIIAVKPDLNNSQLIADISLNETQYLMDIYNKIRAFFDIDADSNIIEEHLSVDKTISPIIKANSGTRVMGSWDLFESIIRTVIGQQISIKAAKTHIEKIIKHVIAEFLLIYGLTHLFQTPEQVLNINITGMPKSRIEAIYKIAESFVDNSLEGLKAMPYDEAIKRLCELPGIGSWSANYIAMRGLGFTNAIPINDLILKNFFAQLYKNQNIKNTVAKWQPWAAYAATYIWQNQVNK